jgi:hypothetical protein
LGNGATVKAGVGYDGLPGDSSRNIRERLLERWRPINVVLVYPMNRDVHGVEKILRVYKRRPLISDPSILEANDSNLAYARKRCVCRFNIKGNEIHDTPIRLL